MGQLSSADLQFSLGPCALIRRRLRYLLDMSTNVKIEVDERTADNVEIEAFRAYG